MKIMKYYINLYKAFFKNTLSRETDYRASFFGDLLDSIINFAITILLFDILYSNVNLITGWSKYQAFFLVGYAQLITSVIFILFMNNLPRIQNYVLNGELDLIILKPCDSQFYVSFRYFYFGGISSLFPALILLGYSFIKINVDLNFWIILILLISMICSTIIAYSVWLILMSLCFFFTKVSQVHELFISILKFMEYPSSIYKGLIRFIFIFIIPIIAISNIPVEYLLNKSPFNNILILFVITAIFITLSRLFWKFAIKKYQSASS